MMERKSRSAIGGAVRQFYRCEASGAVFGSTQGESTRDRCVLTIWRGFKLFVLPKKLPSPAYCTATMFEPCGRSAVLRLAVPFASETGLPMTCHCKELDRARRHAAAWERALSVAVKVTFDPGKDGFEEKTQLSWLCRRE